MQDFYPTPGTISTCMFYTGLDPYTEKPIFVPKTREEKAEQRALLQYFRPENREIVMKALRKAGRGDLIGYGENCLIRPDKPMNFGAKKSDKPTARTGGNAQKSAPSKNGKLQGKPQGKPAAKPASRSAAKPAAKAPAKQPNSRP